MDAAGLDLTTASEEETRAAGERLGRALRRGDAVLLQGDLGTGKTRLAQGIGRGLGCTARINSPTFVLVNDYRGRERLFHADLYRLPDGADAEELGLLDRAEDGVLVVEWPERAGQGLPTDGLLVTISRGHTDCDRILKLKPLGERGRRILASLEAG